MAYIIPWLFFYVICKRLYALTNSPASGDILLKWNVFAEGAIFVSRIFRQVVSPAVPSEALPFQVNNQKVHQLDMVASRSPR